MRKQNVEFRTAFTSEANRTLKNTDSFGFVELDKYACYVIASGIDDDLDATGAKLAVDTIISTFQEAPSLRKATLRRCLRAANDALLHAKSKRKLKASVTVLVTDYVKLRYAQAGNTRFCLYRDGFARMQSQDQSLSMDLVKENTLPPDKLTEHAERHNLYCYLGQEQDFSPHISKKLKLTNADAAALYTRGIWEQVDTGELQDVFADATDDPQLTVDAVEDLLLSRQPEDLETYTFAAVFFNKVYVDPNRKRKVKKALAIALPIFMIALVLTIVLLVQWNIRRNNIAQMEQSFYNTIEYIQSDNYARAKEECQTALNLAGKVKNREIQSDAGNYMKLIESVLAGDENYAGAAYEEAQREYRNAQNRARQADNLGTDYIEARLVKTAGYIDVYDRLALGDTLMAQGQYDKAEEQYLSAKLLAGSLYFSEGRTDAIAALESLYAAMQSDAEEAGAAQQQAAEDAAAASGVLAEGDAAFAKGEYDAALAHYTAALQKYNALEDEAQAEVALAKLDATEEKLAQRQARRAEAEEYERLAQEAYAGKNYVRAKKYYLLAKDVYAGIQDEDKAAEMIRRMELVEMGISEEDQRKSEEETAEVETAAREDAVQEEEG